MSATLNLWAGADILAVYCNVLGVIERGVRERGEEDKETDVEREKWET
jgi:hypothetical protein